MIRQTSAQAYEELVRSGKANCIRARILFKVLHSDHYLTRLELSKEIGETINTTVGQVRPLVKEGLLVDHGKRPCPITGNRVYVLAAVNNDGTAKQLLLF